MDLVLNASTTGPDDAETMAQLLEHAAAIMREAGGDPVDATDRQLEVQLDGYGPQTVFFSLSAT